MALAACTPAAPRNIDDACDIFEDRRGWYAASRESRERWGTPIDVQLAIVHQESRFKRKAKPPRRRILWIFPGPRPSSAYGYAQALDSTWAEYKRETRNWRADRDDFGDAVDFIGWYTSRSARNIGASRGDAFRLYLAYHEGDGGYRRGTWRRKQWLVDTARRVDARAKRYRGQLAQCERRLGRRRWFFGLF